MTSSTANQPTPNTAESTPTADGGLSFPTIAGPEGFDPPATEVRFVSPDRALALPVPDAALPAPAAALAGANQAWTRGAASIPPYSPTGSFPGDYPPAARPVSFDSPGYGYGYAAAPSWAPAFDGPKAWPVGVFTVLFGIFGAISAARRSSDARALGLPGGRYWAVFAGALVGSFALWTLVLGLAIAVAIPAYLQSVTVMTTGQLERQLESSSAAGVTVADAVCLEEAVDATGVGTYQCLLMFTNGDDLTYRITVSDDGTWAASEAD
ncbi:hypothetical protein [Cryptosporangium minutisporangium]|uniref:DUF4333 domain-containing protein n=1 Tax=Cryptosporangium minutisporangium TaxID=113569 RepID=A0ABP6T662_9ACTN